jgi:hypothetical protein
MTTQDDMRDEVESPETEVVVIYLKVHRTRSSGKN